jgi:hypothetical protein
MPTNPLLILMMAVGACLAFTGIFVARTPPKQGGDGQSRATRAVIGLSLAIFGYHLIVWSFPTTLTPLQIDRQLWWVLCLILACLPIASLLMDRFVSRHSADDRDPSETPHDDSGAIR